MFGLIIAAPGIASADRGALEARLAVLSIPVTGYVDAPSPIPTDLPAEAFLPLAAEALLMPGTPLPYRGVLACLGQDPRPSNILRRWLYLQLSLLPYLRLGRAVTPLQGAHLLGEALLCPHVDAENRVSCPLPPGVWTDLVTGECHTQSLRMMRSLSSPLVLVRANSLLPIGVNDRSVCADDADRLTLHWFEPSGSAVCMLADGTRYEARMADGKPLLTTSTDKPCHLILHQSGEEILVR